MQDAAGLLFHYISCVIINKIQDADRQNQFAVHTIRMKNSFLPYGEHLSKRLCYRQIGIYDRGADRHLIAKKHLSKQTIFTSDIPKRQNGDCK